MTARAVERPVFGEPTSSRSLVIRDATEADNGALLELAASCPMAGDITLCITREPDFFALSRLEGDRWRVGVADMGTDGLAGCVAAASRRVYLDGRECDTGYVSDFKVRPRDRGGPAADALAQFVREACREYGGDSFPTLLTVLAGNRAMQRRVPGPRGLPVLTRVATVRSHSIPLLWRRRLSLDARIRVGRAQPSDVDAMASLWTRVARGRQFAPVMGAERFGAWLASAPGLSIHDYWLARDASGRIVGFVAFWDQSSFKQLRVLRYSRKLGMVRRAFNVAAPVFGAPPLPDCGEELRTRTAVHLCVPGDRADVLRALILAAYDALRGASAFLNVALDTRDPLCGALSGLLAQPTDVEGFITSPAGHHDGPELDGRPLHYETALV